MTISEVRRNLAAVVDAVIDDAEETVIPRGGGKAVVIVSLDEWNSMRETLHLLRTPASTRRLLDSIAHAEEGVLEEHVLIDPDGDAKVPAA
ncbi:type II toxin-antitoxin system Phd/YefM family antitoxin [Actinoplanes derwentensis]|nr:type II toxin-antitoxin system prevent-host-death family antitoxin [Actinoplanes derwentensis]